MNAARQPRRTELLLLIACCGFLFFFGLASFGLVGADEPRYAQVAREMLDRGNWVMPTLNGRPWLEKPPLYYWQAMLAYRAGRWFEPDEGGVNDRTARLPGALDAALMIAAIYFFLRRIGPGSELDGALIAASSAAIIGFSRAASTDMPLATTFTIALVAWFRWYQDRGKANLVLFYVFLALATLAKGPVAPALSAVIVLLYVAIKREWSSAYGTLYLPGIVLFLVVSLPWYIAVQLNNRDFFRVFFLEHNLARFSSNLYHHPQPFWFYVPVFLLATLPWTAFLIAATAERLRTLGRERNAIADPDNSWPLFLLVWIFVPLVFFSASQSKLPGYILPAVPAAALLVADYLFSRSKHGKRISPALAVTHGMVCGLLVFAALAAASVAWSAPRHLTRTPGNYAAAAIAAMFTLSVSGTLLTHAGLRLLRPVSLLAVIVGVAAVIRLAAPAIDATQSARPIARTIQAFSREPVPVSLYHTNRETEYGLDFYLNRPTQTYDSSGIPHEAHLLVAAADSAPELTRLLGSRRVSYLTSIPAQKLELYWVGAK